MTTPEEYLTRISQSAGGKTSEGQIQLDFKWDSHSEAISALTEVRRIQRDLKLLRQEIAILLKYMRERFLLELDDFATSPAYDSFADSFGDRFNARINLSVKSDMRIEHRKALEPYKSVILIIDRALVRLGVIRATIYSSPEYSNKPSRSTAEKTRSSRYFVRIANAVKGPLTEEQVRGLLLVGVITPESDLQVEGIDAWVSLADVRALR